MYMKQTISKFPKIAHSTSSDITFGGAFFFLAATLVAALWLTPDCCCCYYCWGTGFLISTFLENSVIDFAVTLQTCLAYYW